MNKKLHTRWLTVLGLLAALAGCGGGGGAAPSVPAPEVVVPAPVLPQGIWKASDANGSLAVIVLPETTGGTVWAIGRSTDGSTSLYRAALTASGQVFTGTDNLLKVTASSSLTVTPSVPGSVPGMPAGNTLTFTLGPDSATLTYGAHYSTPASLASDWAGSWSSSQSVSGLGSVVTSWTVTDGAISGSGSGGCTYTGTVSTRPEAKAVVNVSMTETCGSTVQQFGGIGLPGLDANGNVVGRIVTLLRADGQSFGVLQWSHPG